MNCFHCIDIQRVYFKKLSITEAKKHSITEAKKHRNTIRSAEFDLFCLQSLINISIATAFHRNVQTRFHFCSLFPSFHDIFLCTTFSFSACSPARDLLVVIQDSLSCAVLITHRSLQLLHFVQLLRKAKITSL